MDRASASGAEGCGFKPRRTQSSNSLGNRLKADRHEYTFKTQNAAQEFRLRIKRWKAEQKSPTETLSFDDYDKRWLAYLRAHVGDLELLPEIVGHWQRTAKAITQPLSVNELVKAFVLYRESKGLDKGTSADDRYVAKRLREHLGPFMAHELGPAELRSFLDTAKSPSTRRKFYKIASLVFDYAKEQRVIAINPLDEIPRPKVGYAIPGILTPGEFERLLLVAEQSKPDLVPFLALAGFAGLRRDELVKEYAADQVLQWQDLDWHKEQITIRHEVAKQTSRIMGNRRFPPMEPALIRWLGPYRKEQGPIVPMVDSNFRRHWKKLLALSGVNPPDNALRHSYASYWLARSTKEGLGELAKRMGNSEGLCRRHYLETLTREEGRAWFALRRPKPKQQPSAAISAPLSSSLADGRTVANVNFHTKTYAIQQNPALATVSFAFQFSQIKAGLKAVASLLSTGKEL